MSAALAQLGNQLAELKMQTQSMQQTLQTLSGNQYQWSNTQNLMNQLHGYHAKSARNELITPIKLNEQFQHAYPGYQAPDQFHKQYQTNVNTTQQTFSGVYAKFEFACTTFSR